jgi:hypothetical protein
MMKKTCALLAAAALLAACGETKIDPEAVRAALPAPDAIQIGTPGADATASGGTGRAALAGEPVYGSGYALTSYWTAVTVNVGVWWSLTLVRVVTAFPPTSCDEASCTWGPWEDDQGLNVWRLVVTRAGDDGYAWTLAGQPGSRPEAGFTTLMSGVAYPGPGRDRGHGTFAIDFDAEAGLDHGALWEQEDFGQLSVAYDNRTALSVDATLLGGKSDDPADPVFMNAAYSFDAAGPGGELQLALETLEATPRELSLHTRWDPTGAGRGDARFASGGLTYQASECWGGAPASFALVYASHTDPVYGAESACAFPSAVYADVTLP